MAVAALRHCVESTNRPPVLTANVHANVNWVPGNSVNSLIAAARTLVEI